MLFCGLMSVLCWLLVMRVYLCSMWGGKFCYRVGLLFNVSFCWLG